MKFELLIVIWALLKSVFKLNIAPPYTAVLFINVELFISRFPLLFIAPPPSMDSDDILLF